MDQSSAKKKILEIRKYGFYAYIKGLDKQGLGVMVFDVDDQEVKGVTLKVGQTLKMSMTRAAFENLLAYEILEFVELLPKTVWKDFKKVYNS